MRPNSLWLGIFHVQSRDHMTEICRVCGTMHVLTNTTRVLLRVTGSTVTAALRSSS